MMQQTLLGLVSCETLDQIALASQLDLQVLDRESPQILSNRHPFLPGMSDRQLITMLQMEGAFYTLCTLAAAVGLGSLAGYPLFLYAKKAGMFEISRYHYPWQAAVAVSAALLLIQAGSHMGSPCGNYQYHTTPSSSCKSAICISICNIPT